MYFINKISPFTFSRIVFSATLITLVFLTVLSFQRVSQVKSYTRNVDNSNLLKYEVERCLSFLKDAETGQLGFLITNDSDFLAPVKLANDSLESALNDLKLTALNNNENFIEITNFESAALKRLRHTNILLTNYRESDDFRKSKFVLLKQGKLLMDVTRRIAAKIDRNTERKLKQAIKDEERYSTFTPGFLIITSLFSIAMLIIAYWVIVGELRKRMIIQTDLDYSIEALKRSNSELEQFAYVASHDLQEPLRKIQSFGNRLVLKYNEGMDDDAKFIAERMRSSAERMQTLINDLLNYSRVTNTRSKKLVMVDFNSIITGVIDTLKEEIQEKKAQVTFDKLPSLNCNPLQIEQLFQNLLVNALKFMPDNRLPVIDIKYSGAIGSEIPMVKPSDENKLFYKISVIDNGIGFEEQYIEKIFVIFQRLEGRSEFAGSGIGLAICKKIVQHHGGYITATSKLNEGSAFIVYLPQN